MDTAKKLVMLREKFGFTQDELAEKLFVDRSTISKWENGARLPDRYNVERLSHIFGVKPSEIISSPDYVYFSQDELDLLNNEIEQLLSVSSTEKTPTETVKNLRGFLKSLKEKERKIFMSRYYEGKNSKAIAAEQRLKDENVRVTLSRIRKKMEKYYK